LRLKLGLYITLNKRKSVPTFVSLSNMTDPYLFICLKTTLFVNTDSLVVFGMTHRQYAYLYEVQTPKA
jgi:hypothetical protein